MMLMITKPKSKAKKLLAVGAMVLLLGVAVPLGYETLSDVGAMSQFAAGDNVVEQMPKPASDDESIGEEDVSEGAVEEGAGKTLQESIKEVIFGAKKQVIRY